MVLYLLQTLLVNHDTAEPGPSPQNPSQHSALESRQPLATTQIWYMTRNYLPSPLESETLFLLYDFSTQYNLYCVSKL